MPKYDPDERFTIWPLSGEEALKKALGADEEDDEEVSEAPEEDEPDA